MYFYHVSMVEKKCTFYYFINYVHTCYQLTMLIKTNSNTPIINQWFLDSNKPNLRCQISSHGMLWQKRNKHGLTQGMNTTIYKVKCFQLFPSFILTFKPYYFIVQKLITSNVVMVTYMFSCRRDYYPVPSYKLPSVAPCWPPYTRIEHSSFGGIILPLNNLATTR